MIILCESCKTRYKINDGLVGPEGADVRCSRCENVFTVYPPDDKSGFEDTSQSSDDAGHGTTTVFENKLEGMIDDFETETSLEAHEEDKTKELSLEQLEKTSIVDVGDLLVEDAETQFYDTKKSKSNNGLGLDTDPAEIRGDMKEAEDDDFGLEIVTEDELGVDPDLDDFDLELEDLAFEKSGGLQSSEKGGEAEKFSDIEIKEQEDFDMDIDTETLGEERDYEIDLDLIEEDKDEEIATEDFGFEPGEDEDLLEEDDFAKDLDFEQEQQPVKDKSSAEAEQDSPDFELEIEDDDEKPDRLSADDEEDEFDLTDVEEFLDLEEETKPKPDAGEKEQFDLGLETAADETAGEKDFAIDLETIKDETQVFDGEPTRNISMETAGEKAEAIPPEGKAAPVGEIAGKAAIKDDSYEDMQKTAGAVASGGQFAAGRKKFSFFKVLLLVLLFVVIAGGGYFYMEEIYGPAPPAPPETTEAVLPTEPAPADEDPAGTLQMAISTPEYSFIDNESSGELLVITGNVTNRYDHPRRYVQVQGNIYDERGNLLYSSDPVYAGVIYDTHELATLETAEIQSRLTDAEAAEERAEVEPGQLLPFTVVVSHLPDGMEELSVEVVESTGTGQ